MGMTTEIIGGDLPAGGRDRSGQLELRAACLAAAADEAVRLTKGGDVKAVQALSKRLLSAARFVGVGYRGVVKPEGLYWKCWNDSAIVAPGQSPTDAGASPKAPKPAAKGK